MSVKSTTVRARIRPDLKEEAEAILESIGLSTTDAIRLLFTQITLQRGMPFELKLPNDETKAAIDEALQRQNLVSADSATELIDDLEI